MSFYGGFVISTGKIERFRDFLPEHFIISQISSDGHWIRVEQTNITKLPFCDPQIRKRWQDRGEIFSEAKQDKSKRKSFCLEAKTGIFRLFPIEAKQQKSEVNEHKAKGNEAKRGKQNNKFINGFYGNS
jgi:hypothetical protein